MKDTVTEIYDLYERGVEHHNMVNMYKSCEKYHNFYIGDQWAGLDNDEDLMVFNIIKPIGKYKVAMVAQNQMSIVYSSMSNDKTVKRVCEVLSKFAAATWEKNKMDTLAWRVIKNAFITGDHYAYCFDASGENSKSPKVKVRLVNKTNVYLADEQNPNLDEQEYIIIAERSSVAKLRKLAEKNKIPKEQIELIVSDEDTQTQIGEQGGVEVKSDLGKCTSILYMRKVEGGIEYSRSTKYTVYEEPTLLKGLDTYPVVGLRWEDKIGCARGESGVKPIIPNQLEINKTAARRAIAVKRFSFPTLVYDSEKISDVDNLSKVGASIALQNLGQNPINSLIQYLNPAPISGDAQNLQSETIDRTRQLEGAGDAATGNIDPTQASGAAIRAARDQAAIPLNEQIASYKQFVEDIALLWYKLWVVYSPNGMSLQIEQNGQPITANIPPQALQGLDIDIKIDISPIDPYSKVSQQISLDRLLDRQLIDFTEYVKAIDDGSSIPKATLQAILDARHSAVPQDVINELQANPQMVQAVIGLMKKQATGRKAAAQGVGQPADMQAAMGAMPQGANAAAAANMAGQAMGQNAMPQGVMQAEQTQTSATQIPNNINPEQLAALQAAAAANQAR